MTLDITLTPTASPRSDAELAEILANPGFGTHFTDHMLTVEWTPEQGWHAARIEQYGAAQHGPRLRGAALRAGDLRGDEGLPARRRVHLDLPARGERPADGAVLAPARPAGPGPRGLRAGRGRPRRGRPALGARGRGGEEPLRAALHVRLRVLPRRPPGPARALHGDRLPGRRLLQGRGEAADPVAHRGLHPRRSRRDGRGQDGRQLRQLPGRPAAGDGRGLRPGGLPRRGRGEVRRGARRHEHVLRLRRRPRRHPRDRHHPRGDHPLGDHRARPEEGPPRRGAQVLHRRVARRRGLAARSPRCSPAARPRSSRRSAR